MSTTTANVRIDELIQHIRDGKILEAMEEFYADDVVMTEPYHTTEGKAANIEREKEFLAGVKQWTGFDVTAVAASDTHSFYECSMDWIATDGTSVHVEQVVVAEWRDGRIVRERFYYDTK
jgi:ketosteroid isomerase-like protein